MDRAARRRARKPVEEVDGLVTRTLPMQARGRRHGIAWGLAVLVLAAAAPAPAQPKASPAASGDAATRLSAQQRFDAAQKLFDQQKYAEALAMFQEAYRQSKSPNAHIMIAHCLSALGRQAEAYDELSATVREAAKRAETEPKYAATRDSAATQLALLEPKIGKVVVVIAESFASDVTLNGAPLTQDRLGVPVAVEPGRIVVKASPSQGGPSVRREAMVAAGETKTIAVVFPKASEDYRLSRDDDGVGRRSIGGVRAAGIVVAGIGVAGFTVFGIAGMVVRGKLETLEKGCGGARCVEPRYADVIDSGKTAALVANIGLGAGIMGVVGGGAMIVFGGPSSAADPSARPASGAPAVSGVSGGRRVSRVSVGVLPDGVSIGVAGSF